MTVGVTQARRIGATAVACASTGNTSASLAAYAAQAGIPALVLVPADQVALGKLAQSLAYGARTLLVRGDFDACLRLVEEASTAARRLPAQLDQSVPDRGAEDHRARDAAAARLGAARLDRAAGGQPGEHRGVRQGAAGGAPLGADLAAAAPGRGAGGGRGAVRAELRRGLRAPLRGAGGDGGHGDPDRRPGLVRPRGARHPRDRGRGARGDRRGDPRGQGGGGRQRASAASRPAPPASPGCGSSCAGG